MKSTIANSPMPFWITPKKSDARAIDIFSDSAVSRSAITCSKLTIETLGQGVKYVQS